MSIYAGLVYRFSIRSHLAKGLEGGPLALYYLATPTAGVTDAWELGC